MEECGRGAAVEQLTTRGMLSIPAMGAIGMDLSALITIKISIPAMGGNRVRKPLHLGLLLINPRDGGQ